MAHATDISIEGKKISSVTEILGSELGWNKNALLGWYKKVMTNGLDPVEERDKAGNLGTAVHDAIDCWLSNSEIASKDQEILTKLELFKLFWEGKNFSIIASEQTMIHDKLLYHGTMDLIVKDSDNKVILIDFKTNKSVHNEMICQVAAYKLAWEYLHPSIKIDKVQILHLGSENSWYDVYELTDLQVQIGTNIFLRLLENHNDSKIKGFGISKKQNLHESSK